MNLVETALDLLEEHGWCQGQHIDDDGRMDLLQAYVAADESFLADDDHVLVGYFLLHEECGIWGGAGDKNCTEPFQCVCCWNDRPERIFPQVVEVLNRASKRLEIHLKNRLLGESWPKGM